MIKEFVYNNTGIELGESALRQLNDYCSLLTEWNKQINLTTIIQTEEVLEKHFADSMLGSFAIPRAARVCDIGTGGGFPGVPLKILRDDIRITLVDSIAKKIRFIEHLIKELNLDAEVICSRAEHLPRDCYDIAVSRAVASMPTLLEYMAPLLKIGGRAVLYKTPSEDISCTDNAQKVLGIEHILSKEFVLMSGHSRIIHVFEKKKHTQDIYPRRGNKPRSAPL